MLCHKNLYKHFYGKDVYKNLINKNKMWIKSCPVQDQQDYSSRNGTEIVTFYCFFFINRKNARVKSILANFDI